jgi:hypothetical protein
MVWLVVGFLCLCAGGLILKRREVSQVQGLVFGARTPPGCVIVEALVLLAAAVAAAILAR